MKTHESVLVIIVAAVLGATCQKRELISFYEVPLSCQAVNSIGCGSHAKPLVKALADNSRISKASINHAGTIIAVVWKEGPSLPTISEIFSKFSVPVKELEGEANEKAYSSWSNQEIWLSTTQVDQLSIEEAEVLTQRLMKSLRNSKVIQETVDIRPMHEQIKNVFVEYLLNHDPYSTPDDTDIQSVAKKIFDIGEVYLGKGKMPLVEIRRPDMH